MLSIAVVAAAIAARRGFFEPAATEHGGAARMAVAGDFLVLRVRIAGADRIRSGQFQERAKDSFAFIFLTVWRVFLVFY
jgi:hypothetical protein